MEAGSHEAMLENQKTGASLCDGKLARGLTKPNDREAINQTGDENMNADK